MSDDKQIDINWELANRDAAEWARVYGYDLVSQLSKTTRDRLAVEIQRFIETGDMTVPQLARQLEPIFGEVRAEMIAVTEVTRAYSEGNLAAWQASGVTEGKEWVTANDELVCPICQPLDGQVVPINGEFEGGHHAPPAHVRCRCTLAPVPVFESTLMAEEFALIDGDDDIFATVRPPAGRAPRGKGEEYRLRRRLVSRIQTQMRYQEAAQRNLDKYRGQVGTWNRWRIDVAKERVRQLNQAVSTMIDIVTDPYNNDWVFVNELVDGIIEHVSAMGAMAR